MISKNLDIILKDKNIKNVDVAQALKVSPNLVQEWRSGKSIYTVFQLIDLCDLLDCSADFLLGRGKTIGNWRDALPQNSSRVSAKDDQK